MNPKETDTEKGMFHFENLKLLVHKSCIRHSEEPSTDCDENSDPPDCPQGDPPSHEEE